MEKVRKNKLALTIFLFPALFLFLAILIAPIIMSFVYSFFDWNGQTEWTFVGLKNYIEIFTNKSVQFNKSLGNAIILAILSVLIQLPLALLLALLLARKVKGEGFFVTVFFIPVILSTVVIGQLWSKIYHPDYGILNLILNSLGLKELARAWLGEQGTVLAAVFIPILWQYVGYHMLLMYAGVKTISPEIQEAAKIDGATNWQTEWYVVIPMLKPVLRMCTIFAVTGSLKAFDLIYVLTGGGPNHASEVPSISMVEMFFSRNRYGMGSAIGIFIILLCFFFAFLIQKCIRVEGE
ncbi:putative ABC transporter permease protein YurN [Clostridia bacterium]|nr:putative ABC transporter permease protein YurN [Clostridia bacterium]